MTGNPSTICFIRHRLFIFGLLAEIVPEIHQQESMACLLRRSRPTLAKEDVRFMSEKICYCFDYTSDDILKDIEENGTSTIIKQIMAEKKNGACDCATRNPKKR